jgi:hypothetical protein
MDWFILLFLIPLILVPVVLLCGFAGCGLDVVGTFQVSAPKDLAATVSATGVSLTWLDTNSGIVSYAIHRAPVGQTLPTTGPVVKGTTFADPASGLTEGTTFLYRVVPESSGPYLDYPSNIATATVFPAKPTNLTATPVVDISVDPTVPVSTPPKIELTWTNHSANADGFIVKFRAAGSGTFTEVPQPISASPGPPLGTFTHTGITAGQTYEYQVLAYVDGFDTNGNPKQVRSEPTASVSATIPVPVPMVWKVAFQVALTANIGGGQGDCVVQRLKAPLLAGGSYVKITLAGSLAAPIAIDRMTISQAAGAGDAYDSAPDLADVLVAPGFTLAAGVPHTFGPAKYTLDPAKDLLVAFDIGATGSARRGPLVGAAYFSRNTTDEAGTQNRSPTGYVKTADFVYLIQKIEVFAPGP